MPIKGFPVGPSSSSSDNPALTQQGTESHTLQGQERIQRETEGVVHYENGDMEWPIWEDIGIKTLPKSLFYDVVTAKHAKDGLFHYHVLGKNYSGSGGRINYKNSEKYESNQQITSEESRNPTALNIIKATKDSYLNPDSDLRGQLYNVKDFIFCKHYSIIPNNRMITLRRFAHPISDNLLIPRQATDMFVDNKKIVVKKVDGVTLQQQKEGHIGIPIAQAVTYFGDDTGNNLNDIIGFTTGMEWDNQKQDKLARIKGNDIGLLNGIGWNDMLRLISADGDGGIIGSAINTADRVAGAIQDPNNAYDAQQRTVLDKLTSEGGPLSKRHFVDVNTVNQMYTRGVGLKTEHEFNIKCHYNLTSVAEINSRLMLLDLLANLLSIGTDYGKFLSPETRWHSQKEGIGFPGGAEGRIKLLTDPVAYLQSLLSGINNGQVRKSIEKGVDQFSNQFQDAIKELKEFYANPDKPIAKDSKLYKILTAMMTTEALNSIYYQPLLLTGYPTGEWHVTVGNPLNPIALIGNLICKQVKIEFNSVLGPDDFPTELTATYTMADGRTRHRGDLESMFNKGQGRLYLGKLKETEQSMGAFSSNNLDPNKAQGTPTGIAAGTASRGDNLLNNQ